MSKGVYPRTPKPVSERLWAKVNRDGPIPAFHPEFGACWEWTKAKTSGYGVMGVGAVLQRTHRIAWELASGVLIPTGSQVLHICDNRSCVRNDEPGTYVVKGVVLPRFGHLALGTNQDNITDMFEKGGDGVLTHVRGERAARAVLTESEVREMRKAYAVGESIGAIAIRYGVGYTGVHSAVHRRTWKHVP